MTRRIRALIPWAFIAGAVFGVVLRADPATVAGCLILAAIYAQGEREDAKWRAQVQINADVLRVLKGGER